MLKVSIKNIKGQNVGEVELSESVFGVEPNAAVLHAYVKAYLANQRHGTPSRGRRSEAAASSPGGKRARATRARGQPVRPSGGTAAWYLRRNPATTDFQ